MAHLYGRAEKRREGIVMSERVNMEVAGRLEEVARLLDEQGANRIIRGRESECVEHYLATPTSDHRSLSSSGLHA